MFIYKFDNFDMEKISDNSNETKERFAEVAYLLKALANETRLCVVLQLMHEKEKSVSELMISSGCEQSLLSHHLTDMRAKGILDCRRSGKKCYYSIKDNRIIPLMKCVLDCAEEDE